MEESEGEREETERKTWSIQLSSRADLNYYYSLLPLCTQPPTVICKMEAQLENAHISYTFFARLAPSCMLSRCLFTKISASELSRKFIKSALLVGYHYTIQVGSEGGRRGGGGGEQIKYSDKKANAFNVCGKEKKRRKLMAGMACSTSSNGGGSSTTRTSWIRFSRRWVGGWGPCLSDEPTFICSTTTVGNTAELQYKYILVKKKYPAAIALIPQVYNIFLSNPPLV